MDKQFTACHCVSENHGTEYIKKKKEKQGKGPLETRCPLRATLITEEAALEKQRRAADQRLVFLILSLG